MEPEAQKFRCVSLHPSHNIMNKQQVTNNKHTGTSFWLWIWFWPWPRPQTQLPPVAARVNPGVRPRTLRQLAVTTAVHPPPPCSTRGRKLGENFQKQPKTVSSSPDRVQGASIWVQHCSSCMHQGLLWGPMPLHYGLLLSASLLHNSLLC